ncbi:aldose 1-epimerase family protein [Mucilaginibacter flavidus]|uniref:aldose 1-epimerase family protein n=1 Tax=Mucilaginibacter flavidus TaxID=2949309 RepID=UPI00209295C5|nr:aldose 1-epimerase family protein [Mucilaginibacter flavidus]MCO5949102.1 aldose 1-epimerase family protein [Mucilaginibacter flavidus]
MAILENDFLRVEINAKGAQLTSVFNKETQTEHMWQADASIWPWHAPNLFPVVGGLINDELLVDGQTYHMSRHGFARQSEFVLLESDDVHAVYSLPNSETTLKVYPYKFDFQVLYNLIDNALRLTYKLISHDKKTIYFSVGGHPAFRVPFNAGEKYEDYYLEFETGEKLETYSLSTDGFFTGETHPVPTSHNRLYLTRDLFKADALVFKNLKSREVCIKSDNHDKSISVEFPHFNYLGIWAKPGADFVCIEPWLGCADSVDKHVDISQKEEIQQLKPGHVFEAAFFISV